LNKIKARRRSITHQIPTFILILPFFIMMIMLVGIPLIAVLMKSFTLNNFLLLEFLDSELLKNTEWTISNYVTLFTNNYYYGAIWQTFAIAIFSVLLCALIGTPVAYTLVKENTTIKKLARFIITVPIYVPDVVILFALLNFLGRRGILNQGLNKIGLNVDLAYNVPGVIIGTFLILFSTFVLIVAATMERIDWSKVEAANSLGASEFRAFMDIIIPLVSPGIIAASLLTLSTAVGLVTVALVIGGGQASMNTIPLEIMGKISGYGSNVPLASAMAVLLLFLTLVGQVITNRISGETIRNVL
jgi:ABC-type spermidine/putrescine transport system permease subunit I